MFWHFLLLFVSPLCSLLLHLDKDDRNREILALRQQLVILRRQLRPATLVGWHRQIVRRHWTFRQRRGPGRPRVSREAEQLALRIARENPTFGCWKIAGEVRKLGYAGFGRSTVKRILDRHGLAPRPTHTGMRWHEFLGHYGHFIWACDFFTVTTASLRTYYVLFFIEISTRRLVFWKVSQHPSGAWVTQQFRNLSITHHQLPRYLIHDRDSKFSAEGDQLLRSMETRAVRLPFRSPNLNAQAERWVRTAREECLDHIIVLSERHLRWVLGEFIAYYNERRPHRSKGLGVLSGDTHFPQVGKVA